MKALLREYNGEQFVWANVKYKNNCFITSDGDRIVENNIIDISRDSRSKYVICSVCGEMVKNTPEAIEAHWREKAKNKNCLTCAHLKEGYRNKPIKKTYSPDPNEPGKFIVQNKYSTELVCGYSWSSYPINTDDADNVCQCFKCKRAEYTVISDIFTRTPHPFEVLPTVDMLIKKRWKLDNIRADHMYYHHPVMTTLTACVNSKGIVSFFTTTCGGYTRSVMYSYKYDKLYFLDSNGHYNPNLPWKFTYDKKESVTKKIKELFVEVK